MKRFVMAAVLAAVASSWGGPALAQGAAPGADLKALAEQLSDCPDVPVTQVNPDGTKPTVPCTRQWVKGRVVRQNIRMSFNLGSAELTQAARASLDGFAQGLKTVGAFRPFTVEGHTDSSGSAATNQRLSRARAQAVVDHLAARGVDRSRMTARGYGFSRPLPGRPASDPANRRVEVVAR